MQHAYIYDSYDKKKHWWEFNRQTKSYERQQEKKNWIQRESINRIWKESMVTAVTISFYRFLFSTNYSKMYWEGQSLRDWKFILICIWCNEKRIFHAVLDCWLLPVCDVYVFIYECILLTMLSMCISVAMNFSTNSSPKQAILAAIA